MKGWRSIAVWVIVGLLGAVTALEAVDVKAFLLPLVCQVDPALPMPTGDVCVDKLLKVVGMWTSGLAAVGVFLRMITNTSIFKSLK